MVFNGTGTNTITTVLSGVNDLTDGAFGFFVLLIVFGIVYMMNGSDPTRDKVAGAMFITFVVSVLLWSMGVLSGTYMTISGVLMVGSVVMLVVRN